AVAALRTPGSKYTPSSSALADLVQATYFRVESRAVLPAPGVDRRGGLRWRLGAVRAALWGDREALGAGTTRALQTRRIVWICTPFEGCNEIPLYKPPFRLHRYDSRWQAKAA